MQSANACSLARTFPQRTPDPSPDAPILQRGVPPTLSATLLLVSTVSVPLLTLGCGSGTLAELHLPCLCSQLESWQCLWRDWELSYQHPPWEAWACACPQHGAALAWGPQPVCQEALIKVWPVQSPWIAGLQAIMLFIVSLCLC